MPMNEITCEVANAAEHVTSTLSTIILKGYEALLAYNKAVLKRAVARLTVSRSSVIAHLLPCKLMLLSAAYGITVDRDSGSKG